jgi:hypothetical protein
MTPDNSIQLPAPVTADPGNVRRLQLSRVTWNF